MKLFVALGPGDIVAAARLRCDGQAIPETSVAYSELLFDFCKSESLQTLAISSCPRIDALNDQIIQIENRPKFMSGSSGLLFHFSFFSYACYLAYRAWRFGASTAIIDSGTTHYFLLTLFRCFGIKVAINMHNVFWPVGFPPKRGIHRLIRAINAWFFRNIASGAMGVSPECERQALAESNNHIPFFQYRCQFNREGFLNAKSYEGGPFHVVCAGRVEENKGFLDIVEIAERLRILSKVPVIFHICGDGPALTNLLNLIVERKLEHSILVYGRVQRKVLLERYAKSHALIVPTRSTFTEGMPQVCAEAVLSGLPVIASPVTNAFDVIGAATIAAETDNPDSYAQAILKLMNDTELYKKLKSECFDLSKQFLDPSQAYGMGVKRLLNAIYPTPKYHCPPH
jgi:glycogen synthase